MSICFVVNEVTASPFNLCLPSPSLGYNCILWSLVSTTSLPSRIRGSMGRTFEVFAVQSDKDRILEELSSSGVSSWEGGEVAQGFLRPISCNKGVESGVEPTFDSSGGGCNTVVWWDNCGVTGNCVDMPPSSGLAGGCHCMNLRVRGFFVVEGDRWLWLCVLFDLEDPTLLQLLAGLCQMDLW